MGQIVRYFVNRVPVVVSTCLRRVQWTNRDLVAEMKRNSVHRFLPDEINNELLQLRLAAHRYCMHDITASL